MLHILCIDLAPFSFDPRRELAADPKSRAQALEAGERLSSPEFGETTVIRFKTIFSDRLQTRRIDHQFKELLLKSAILNRMAHLGMPDSVKITG
jgi:hypothetical protein